LVNAVNTSFFPCTDQMRGGKIGWIVDRNALTGRRVAKFRSPRLACARLA